MLIDGAEYLADELVQLDVALGAAVQRDLIVDAAALGGDFISQFLPDSRARLDFNLGLDRVNFALRVLQVVLELLSFAAPLDLLAAEQLGRSTNYRPLLVVRL